MTNHSALDWYEDNAEQYASSNPDLPIRKSIEWPAVRSLLPDIIGKRILDAGCGDGTYSRRLADDGAEVIGVDFSKNSWRLQKTNTVVMSGSSRSTSESRFPFLMTSRSI